MHVDVYLSGCRLSAKITADSFDVSFFLGGGVGFACRCHACVEFTIRLRTICAQCVTVVYQAI